MNGSRKITRISVVTVTKNCSDSILTTLDSLLHIPLNSLEFINVDGNSTDNTAGIISAFMKKNNIKFIQVIEGDSGIYDAMNKGLSMVSGDVIGFLNSNDFYEKDVFSSLVNAFSHNDTDIVIGKMNLIDNYKRIISVSIPNINVKKYLQMRINHPSTFIRKKVYDEIGFFDTSLKIAADKELILRAVKAKKSVLLIENVLSNYTIQGYSSNIKLRDIRSRLKENYRILKQHYSKPKVFLSLTYLLLFYLYRCIRSDNNGKV